MAQSESVLHSEYRSLKKIVDVLEQEVRDALERERDGVMAVVEGCRDRASAENLAYENGYRAGIQDVHSMLSMHFAKRRR